MAYVLALDQGTTSSRAIVFDHDGVIRSVAQREFKQIFPQTGWVEHDPEEIWASQISVAVEALGRAGTRPRDIAAVGITNQRETTIVWDRETGKPVYNAIVWQDRRTAAFCDQLKAAGHEALIQQRTGLLIDAYFSGSKIRWFLDYVPDARRLANAGRLVFGTVDSWLLWKLTSGRLHVTDVSNASRTMLFNIHTCQWDEDLLELFDIPVSMLPDGARFQRSLRRGDDHARSGLDPHRRNRGRSAGFPFRAEMHFARLGKKYLRHWMLPVAEYRPSSGSIVPTA